MLKVCTAFLHDFGELLNPAEEHNDDHDRLGAEVSCTEHLRIIVYECMQQVLSKIGFPARVTEAIALHHLGEEFLELASVRNGAAADDLIPSTENRHKFAQLIESNFFTDCIKLAKRDEVLLILAFKCMCSGRAAGEPLQLPAHNLVASARWAHT